MADILPAYGRLEARVIALRAALSLLIEEITDVEAQTGASPEDWRQRIVALAQQQRRALEGA